ncbi:hypothetical protein OMR07_12095 [Methylobacterium organophilum]|nr:hypothetical protein [Methylobacterium organophilum]
MRRPQTVDAHVYADPNPVTVAIIMATKGAEMAAERWHWCEPRTLATLARIKRALTGMAPQGTRIRTSALTGREAIAVEAAAVLDSLTAVDTALGVPINSTRTALQARGLPVPRNAASRSIEGQLGRRIKLGDETALAEREARRDHARAVCDVLAAALALGIDVFGALGEEQAAAREDRGRTVARHVADRVGQRRDLIGQARLRPERDGAEGRLDGRGGHLPGRLLGHLHGDEPGPRGTAHDGDPLRVGEAVGGLGAAQDEALAARDRQRLRPALHPEARGGQRLGREPAVDLVPSFRRHLDQDDRGAGRMLEAGEAPAHAHPGRRREAEGAGGRKDRIGAGLRGRSRDRQRRHDQADQQFAPRRSARAKTGEDAAQALASQKDFADVKVTDEARSSRGGAVVVRLRGTGTDTKSGRALGVTQTMVFDGKRYLRVLGFADAGRTDALDRADRVAASVAMR